MNRFENQVAIVTGAAQGIGKAYAKALCAEGAIVIIVDYNKEVGYATEAELIDNGLKAEFMQCNVAEEDQVKQVADQVFKKYGRIDILINNAQAGKNVMAPLVETTFETMMLACTTGFIGSFLFIKHVAPYMKEKTYGRIVNVASNNGVKGMANFVAYGPQKEAIRGLTRVAANELGEFNITCNVICPSARTEESRKWAEKYPEKAAEALKPQPIKHVGNPEIDVAPVVMFLCSAEAGFVTGQTVGVDGGQTMMQ